MNPLTWDQFRRKSFDIGRKYPIKDILWYPSVSVRNNKFLNQMDICLYHYLPAYVIDTVTRIRGQRPRMVSAPAGTSATSRDLTRTHFLFLCPTGSRLRQSSPGPVLFGLLHESPVAVQLEQLGETDRRHVRRGSPDVRLRRAPNRLVVVHASLRPRHPPVHSQRGSEHFARWQNTTNQVINHGQPAAGVTHIAANDNFSLSTDSTGSVSRCTYFF